MFYINVSYLNKRFGDTEQLLKPTSINYDNIALSETRIMRNLEITKNIDIKDYNMKYT